MAFVDGQILTAEELNTLASKEYVNNKAASVTDYAKQAAIDIACFSTPITVNDIEAPTKPTLYNLGEITTLDLSKVGTSGYEVIIMFTVGDTAVNVTYPESYKTMGDIDFSSLNTDYLVSILEGVMISQVITTVTAS